MPARGGIVVLTWCVGVKEGAGELRAVKSLRYEESRDIDRDGKIESTRKGVRRRVVRGDRESI